LRDVHRLEQGGVLPPPREVQPRRGLPGRPPRRPGDPPRPPESPGRRGLASPTRPASPPATTAGPPIVPPSRLTVDRGPNASKLVRLTAGGSPRVRSQEPEALQGYGAHAQRLHPLGAPAEAEGRRPLD